MFDYSNKATTLPIESRYNFTALDLSPNGCFLIAIDEGKVSEIIFSSADVKSVLFVCCCSWESKLHQSRYQNNSSHVSLQEASHLCQV